MLIVRRYCFRDFCGLKARLSSARGNAPGRRTFILRRRPERANNTRGQVTGITESVDGVSNTVAFEYDSFGRLYKKTFNSVDYEQYDYQNGYLYKIGFNGTTVWQATAIDEYSRVRAANMGSTAATWGYNTTTNLLSQIKGTGVQQYDYNFSGTTRNLTTRYIWIGGDAYTAVAVATKEGAGSWTVYNIFRDHLGTITHLKTGSTIIEYSFDACSVKLAFRERSETKSSVELIPKSEASREGRLCNKDDWSYTLTNEPALFADRGFTGHEFLADFNLYNMNGRLYDPVVGRFLSPDPFIADPSFSQSYNRYAYCFNNPLIYTDPTGEIFGSIFTFLWEGTKAVVKSTRDFVKTAFFEGGLDPTSSNARQNAWDNYGDDFRGYWADFDPTKSGNKTNNAIKIDVGLFLHIPGWETPQTIVGNLASHFRNLTGNVDNVDIDWKRFTVLVNDDDPGVRGWGFTFGPYINSRNLEVGDDTYMHELGHTIQSRILGPLYITKVAIPSGLSYWFGSDDYHNNCWYEVWASRLGGAPNHQKDYRSKSFWYWFGVIGIPIFPN